MKTSQHGTPLIVWVCLLTMLISMTSSPVKAQNSWLPTPLTSIIDGMASNSQGHLFAHGYQLFRSTDSGASWTAIGSGIANEAVFKPIGISGNGDVFIGRWRSVWRSQDNGDTWQKIDTTMGDVHSFAFGNNDEIFAASTVRGSINQRMGAIRGNRPRLPTDWIS